MDNKDKYLLAVGGLILGIGILYRRAKGIYDDSLLYKSLKEELKDGLSEVFSGVDDLFDYVDKLRENKIINKMFYKNDNEVYRLRSIFANLSLEKDVKSDNWFYELKPLALSEHIFPVKGDVKTSYKEYWESFKKEFNDILKQSGLKFEHHKEQVLSLIYHLLYKYLWCVPAYDEDTSLFDHSRTLAAVVSSFYDYYRERFLKDDLDEKENVFLHIKGDISGIQKFIYNVYAGKGGVAKILRGRSFYIALLPEVLSRYILSSMGYPRVNLLYSGGGIFEILVANTEQNINKLKDIKADISRFLACEFEADLGLSLSYHQYSAFDMMTNYKDVLRKLNENLDNAKKHRFSELIDSAQMFDALNKRSSGIGTSKKRCPVCKTYLIDETLTEEDEICDVCEVFRRIGQYLPRTTGLVFARKGDFDSKKVIHFGDFGAVYLLSKEDSENVASIFYSDNTTEILSINDTSFSGRYKTGFKFMGKVVPRATEDIPAQESGEDEEIIKGQIVTFTYLAKASDGDSRIGLLRMDIDNLGRLFSEGLKDKMSISRVAMLSRSIELFFAGYLNSICNNLSKSYKTDIKIDNMFYILYSGGDDVFIIAPWDKTIDIAIAINSEFRKYVCENDNVTISAGYIQTKPRFPIRISADIAGELEEISKASGKNRISILGDVLDWHELEDIKSTAQEWVSHVKSGKLQRGFIYTVHRLKEQFLKDESKSSKLVFSYKSRENLMFYPYAQYYIARNIHRDLREKIAQFLFDKKNFKKLTFLVNYISLKTRGNTGTKEVYHEHSAQKS